MRGYHYHNPTGGRDFGQAFVARTLLKNLMLDEVVIPQGERWPGGPATFPLKKLGISHAVLISDKSVAKSVDWNHKLLVDDVDEEPEKKPPTARPSAQASAPMGQPAGPGGDNGSQTKKKPIDAPRYDFVVQFCWQVPSPDTMVELAAVYPGVVDPANAAEGEPSDAAEGGGAPAGAPAQPPGPDAAKSNSAAAAAGSDGGGIQNGGASPPPAAANGSPPGPNAAAGAGNAP